MFNEHWAQERSQKQERQRVEHGHLIYMVTVTCVGRNAYTFINGKRHNVYPTGNDNEPWTTNISMMK
jgi:hypothetical protein